MYQKNEYTQNKGHENQCVIGKHFQKRESL